MFFTKLNKGAKENEIMSFQRAVKEKLNKELPEQYLDILKIINGLNLKGVTVYGIDSDFLENKPKHKINGFIGINKIQHENPNFKNYLFLGNSNISWYVYDSDSSKYIEINKPSCEIINSYDNIYDMFDKLIEDIA